MKKENNIINENVLDDIKHFFEIASPEILQKDIVKKLKDFFKDKIDFIGKETSSILGSVGSKPSAKFDKEPPTNISSNDDDFYKQILKGIGVDWNDRTKLMMYAWRRAESGNCKNNPFNTKEKLSGVNLSFCNSDGVKHYPTKEDGIKATLETLKGGRKNYGYEDIINSLKTGDTDGFISAIKKSSWGTSGDLVGEILEDYYDGTSTTRPTPIQS